MLTGTPLQNNLEELYALLSFLEPDRFSNPIAFMADFGDLKTDNQVEKLKAVRQVRYYMYSQNMKIKILK